MARPVTGRRIGKRRARIDPEVLVSLRDPQPNWARIIGELAGEAELSVIHEKRYRELADAELMTIIGEVRDRFDAMEVRAAEVAALRATIDELQTRLDRLEGVLAKAAPIRLVG